jgi:hypothetical protein
VQHHDGIGRIVRTREIDHGVAHFGFHGGPVVTLTASRVTEQKVRSIEVTTPSAFIVADLLRKEIQSYRNTVSTYQAQDGGVSYQQHTQIDQVQVPTAEPLLLEVQDFIRAIRQVSRRSSLPRTRPKHCGSPRLCDCRCMPVWPSRACAKPAVLHTPVDPHRRPTAQPPLALLLNVRKVAHMIAFEQLFDRSLRQAARRKIGSEPALCDRRTPWLTAPFQSSNTDARPAHIPRDQARCRHSANSQGPRRCALSTARAGPAAAASAAVAAARVTPHQSRTSDCRQRPRSAPVPTHRAHRLARVRRSLPSAARSWGQVAARDCSWQTSARRSPAPSTDSRARSRRTAPSHRRTEP